MKRLFLKAAGVAAAGALLKACGGGGGGGGGGPTGSTTLLQILQQDGRFSRLLGALQNAGLADRLGAAGDSLTLFAPTNDTFSTLESRIGSLSDQKLAELIGFHVVPRFLSASTLNSFVSSNERPATLYSFGGDAAVLIFVNENNQLTIWDGVGQSAITLAQTDVAASNGVLHVVNKVLLPRHVLTVAQMLRVNSDSEFGAAMSDSDISLLSGAGPYTVFQPTNDAISGAVNVRHHVLGLQLPSDNFPTTATTYTPLVGRQIQLVKGGAGAALATISDSTGATTIVSDVDFFATNGVIHTINRVLVP